MLRPRLSSTAFALAVGVTAAVTAASASAAYIYSLHHFDTLLANARSTALAEGELVRAALEHQMVENDRSLIARMIETFGHQPGIERLLLLDRHGVMRFSAGVPPAPADMTIGSPTCQACHRLPPDQRGSTRVIETSGGTLLRTVVPVRNREACYGCHDPARRINGILILDVNAGEMRAGMNRDLRWMVAGSAVLTLALVAAIALVFRIVVLRRLNRFEVAARQIAAGDLERRVPSEGSDTISWLAREFNVMADSVTGLVGEVRTQRERLETIMNSIDDGIAVLDAERRIVAANDAFLRRAGQAREQVLGCCCSDTAAGNCSVPDCPTLSCLASGARQVRICERSSPAGEARWEEVHSSPIRDDSGRVTHVVEVWRDISDRRKAEARLAESHRLASLGLLASGFSHELNTPLATVLTCVEGIVRESREEGEPADLRRIREHAGIARDQVLRCRGITQHFLRLYRGQASPGDIVDLRETISMVARLVEPTARAHGVSIELKNGPAPARVHADEADLQQAFINLLLNAVQACDKGGHVVAEIDGGADAIRVRIADDGCGIAPDARARIFEPFVSLRRGGTGLGLFLTLNMVQRWGGDIRVQSTPGRGSTFEVTLPPLVARAVVREVCVVKRTGSILLVDDDDAFRTVMAGELAHLGFEVAAAPSGEDALRQLAEAEPSVMLLDLQLPGLSGLEVLRAVRERHAGVEVIMLTGHGSIDTAIESIRAGAFDYVAKPCPIDELEVRIERALERQSLRRRASVLERGLTPPDPGGSLIGDTPQFREALHLIDRVAPTDSTVLITGETGSGKEMVAKLLHAHSARRNRPFVVVECAALQESLLQSELFGHERGAFTGADRAKPGLFEVAHGGTIFLDEIGEVSLATQVKLLRVLDASTFRHVGGTQEIRVNVRVVAATNRDLVAMVRQALFREDLYYRLSTVTVRLPPLRERADDIPMLASHFARLLGRRTGCERRISADAIDRLRRHDWPGNVRELLHVVEAASIVCEGEEILLEHLPAALRATPPAAPAAESTSGRSLLELERAHIERTLRETGGHRAQAAGILGISERNLYRKLRQYGLLA